jgi:hypothetical protein
MFPWGTNFVNSFHLEKGNFSQGHQQGRKLGYGVMVFNTTFNNISVLLVEETGVTEENHGRKM